MLTPSDHHEIHHGRSTVNGFIEQHKIENLLMDSAIMFAEWLGTTSGKSHRYSGAYTGMIQDINIQPRDFKHVLSVTRRVAEDTRQERIVRWNSPKN